MNYFLGGDRTHVRDPDPDHTAEEAGLDLQSTLQGEGHHHQKGRPILVSQDLEANHQTVGAVHQGAVRLE